MFTGIIYVLNTMPTMLDTVTTCNYTSFDIMINVRHTLIWVFGVQILIGLIYAYIYILKCTVYIYL